MKTILNPASSQWQKLAQRPAKPVPALEEIVKQRKSKFKSAEEFKSMGGMSKGQLISKEHLRNLSWKKRA